MSSVEAIPCSRAASPPANRDRAQARLNRQLARQNGGSLMSRAPAVASIRSVVQVVFGVVGVADGDAGVDAGASEGVNEPVV